ncbi:cytochrome P450 [Streptomyces sp. URMC 123]|uniref:cytochrome P450 n=1 Tax=Streptomyces sp. URMC 123 TaxID=3423403 RepID=UPI003F1B3023
MEDVRSTENARSAGRAWRSVPAPGALPLLGHALTLRRRPLEFLASLPARGDLVEVRLGPRPAYVVCHPDLVHAVLADPRTYDKGGPLFDKVRPLLGNGLGTSGWAAHRRQRRLVGPAFHRARVDGYAAGMLQEIEALAGSWRPGHVLDVGVAMQALTARATARTLFSADITERDVADIQHCLAVLFGGVYRRMTAPLGLWEKLPTPANRRFRLALARLRELIDRIVDDYARAGRAGGGRDDRGDLLSALMAPSDEGAGEGADEGVSVLSADELRDQVMTLLVAGTEPTGHAMAWAFHLLGTHPEVEGRLHEELDTVLAGRPAGVTDLPRLAYTRRVLTEVLRLYPPGWMFTRTTTAATELAGRRLAPGTTVLYSPYALHRDPRHFPRPDSFDPDRWLPHRAKDVPRGALLPFGAGTRRCVGEHFGTTEAMLTIATVGARWRLRPVPGRAVRPRPETTLGTGPLPMRAEPRGAGARSAGG